MCWTDDTIPLVYLTDRNESGAVHPPGGTVSCARLETVVDVARGIYYVAKILKYARQLGGPPPAVPLEALSPVAPSSTPPALVEPPLELLEHEHDDDA